MKNILLQLYSIWVILVFSVFMLILLPFIIIPVLIHPRAGIITIYAVKLWSWLFSQFNFIHYKIINRKNVARRKAYVYTCNHTSFLDVPGITMAVRGQFRAIAKKELLKVPVFGLIVRLFTIVVDRSSTESRKASIARLRYFLERKISVFVFPEGTQSRTKEVLQPFFNGAFRTAIETKTPIMPMVVVGAGRLMPPGGLNVRPGKVKVIFGDEIPTDNYSLDQMGELKQRTFEQMRELILAHA